MTTHEVIAETLEALAGRMAELGYIFHAWTIRMTAQDFSRLSTLEAECGIDRTRDPGDGVLDRLLGSLDAGLAPNGKNGRRP
jgi:hypothetical protein